MSVECNIITPRARHHAQATTYPVLFQFAHSHNSSRLDDYGAMGVFQTYLADGNGRLLIYVLLKYRILVGVTRRWV